MRIRNQLRSRLTAILTCSILVTLPIQASIVSDFDSLNYWGTGDNRSAMVIDWNDQKTSFSLAWGFRWDGTLTVADMLLSLTAADDRLFLRIDSEAGFGTALFGIGNQLGTSAFGVTGAQDTVGNPVTPVFVSGIDDLNTDNASTQSPASSLNAMPLNPVDRYQEGWSDNGFWGLYFAGSDNFSTQPQFTYPVDWIDAWLGVSGADLVDDGWYGLSFAPGFAGSEPSPAHAAIPEPGMMVLMAFGSILLCFWRTVRRG